MNVSKVKYEDEQRLKSDLSQNINILDSPGKIVSKFLNVNNNQDVKNYYNYTNIDPYGLPMNEIYKSNGLKEKMGWVYPNKNKTWLLKVYDIGTFFMTLTNKFESSPQKVMA